MATENKEECQHSNQDQTSMDFDGDGMYRWLVCLDCGDKIREYYERVNVFNATKGGEEEEEERYEQECPKCKSNDIEDISDELSISEHLSGRGRIKCISCGYKFEIYSEWYVDEEEEEVVKVRGEVPQKFFDWFQKQIYKDDGTDIGWMKKVDIYEEEEEERSKKRFRQNFKKEVYGFFEVEANSKEEAQEEFDKGDYDEFDNKSDYETEEWEEDEEEILEEHLRHDAFRESSEEEEND